MKTKTVVIFSSEKVYYRTEMTVPEDATDDDISNLFFEMEHDDKTLEVTESDYWHIDEISHIEESADA